jgi:transposase
VSEYSEAFKATMVRKMLLPGGPTATTLAKTSGVPQPTLSRWLRDATHKTMTDDPEPVRLARRPQDWKPEEKLRVLLESAALSGEQLGTYLRREGLYEADLNEWRRTALVALGAPDKPHAYSADARRVRELEKQLSRKDKALAEAAALLVLKKKVHDLWGDEDDDTKKSTDR